MKKESPLKFNWGGVNDALTRVRSTQQAQQSAHVQDIANRRKATMLNNMMQPQVNGGMSMANPVANAFNSGSNLVNGLNSNLANMSGIPSNALTYNQMNPKAFSDIGAMQNAFGTVVPNTYNRRVGSPFMQNLPPDGVQTDITPDYEINNV